METKWNAQPGASYRPAVPMSRMFAFFIPLGISSSLVMISHMIINGTLTRSSNPELVLSTYAVAMSLLGITEKPAVLLRQTCSALVRDRTSFRALSRVAILLFTAILGIGGLVSFTGLGRFVFGTLFGAEGEQITPIMHVYRILMFVSLFSGLRCLFHGIIIYNRRTMLLTIGMVIRLAGMYALSQYYISIGVDSGQVGAVIFLAGMIIEAFIAVWEGWKLYRKGLPEKIETHPIEETGQVWGFYRPLLYSSIISVILMPATNIVLGHTPGGDRSIAAFALAAGVAQLVLSFFGYMHQIVLNFYRQDERQVKRFLLLLGFIPTILLGVLSFTPLGAWLMTHPLGAKEQLLDESLKAMRLFMMMTFVFTWLDCVNGLLMLRGQTKVMVWSQTSNAIVTILTLVICIVAVPELNSGIGVLAQSFGMAAELAIVVWTLRGSSGAEYRTGADANGYNKEIDGGTS